MKPCPVVDTGFRRAPQGTDHPFRVSVPEEKHTDLRCAMTGFHRWRG